MFTLRPPELKRGNRARPHFCIVNCRVVPTTPKPYTTLRQKLMEEDSSRYLVGQETSPMLKPKNTHWTSIWLSKTKSSEFSSKGSSVSTLRLNARKPVWYSESFTPRNKFSKAVRKRLAMYL